MEWVEDFMSYCERPIYVACLAVLLLHGEVYAEESAFIVKQEGDRITTTRASDKVTLVTQHAGAEMRPYLHPILAPNGKGELTEFSPGHHKHQTGLYWGFTRVNDRDYFHNNKGDSWLRKDMRILETQGSQAKWQVVYDMLGADKKTVLTETQTWTLTDQGAQYTLDLEWQGLAVVDVTFGKYAYGGLFLRMPWTSKSGGEAINSEGLANGKAEGARARWVDVGMPIEGRDDWGHIVIMDHPKNDGHPTLWRVDGQLGVGPCRACAGEWQLSSGQTATFRHRILVYTGKTDREKVESQWDSYTR